MWTFANKPQVFGALCELFESFSGLKTFNLFRYFPKSRHLIKSVGFLFSSFLRPFELHEHKNHFEIIKGKINICSNFGELSRKVLMPADNLYANWKLWTRHSTASNIIFITFVTTLKHYGIIFATILQFDKVVFSEWQFCWDSEDSNEERDMARMYHEIRFSLLWVLAHGFEEKFHFSKLYSLRTNITSYVNAPRAQ